MITRMPFASGEWYHCFTRGIDKRATFKERRDYERFLQQMHVCNTARTIHRSDLAMRSTEEILKIPLTDKLVAVGAFCLMPNHFHLILSESKDNGIPRFMQKLGTAYSMYFNIKNKRTGGLFVSPFRSKRLHNDEYFQYALQYIHCNPAELYEPRWKEGHVSDMQTLENKLRSYPYSSLGAFENEQHPLRGLVDRSIFDYAQQPPLDRILDDAQEYYALMSR